MRHKLRSNDNEQRNKHGVDYPLKLGVPPTPMRQMSHSPAGDYPLKLRVRPHRRGRVGIIPMGGLSPQTLAASDA